MQPGWLSVSCQGCTSMAIDCSMVLPTRGMGQEEGCRWKQSVTLNTCKSTVPAELARTARLSSGNGQICSTCPCRSSLQLRCSWCSSFSTHSCRLLAVHSTQAFPLIWQACRMPEQLCSLHTARGPGVKSPMQHQSSVSYRLKLAHSCFFPNGFFRLMAGRVSFKFRSAISPDSVTFDGAFVSVWELKELIAKRKGLGEAAAYELVISRGGKDLTDDNELLPRNTSVQVRRVPGQRPAGRSAGGAGGPAAAAPVLAAPADEFGSDMYAKDSQEPLTREEQDALEQAAINQTASNWAQQVGACRHPQASGQPLQPICAGFEGLDASHFPQHHERQCADYLCAM